MEDARIRNTKKNIYEAMGQLLEEKPLRKITVTEICQKAGINRATFYRHYMDPEDLAKAMEQNSVNQLVKSIAVITSDASLEEVLVDILRMFKNSTMMKMLETQQIEGDIFLIVRQVGEACYKLYQPVYERKHPEQQNDSLKQQLMYAYISSGVTGIMAWWVQTGMKQPETEIAQEIMKLVNSSMVTDL